MSQQPGTSDGVRKSQRCAGVEPEFAGLERTTSRRREPKRASKSAPAKSVKSNVSERTRQLRAEIQAAEEMAKIQEEEDRAEAEARVVVQKLKQLETRRKIVQKKLALEKSIIEEGEIEDSDDSFECCSMTSGPSKVNEWLANANAEPKDKSPPVGEPFTSQEEANRGDRASSSSVSDESASSHRRNRGRSPPPNGPYEQIAKAVTALTQLVQNQAGAGTGGGEMKQFVARQSLAKELHIFTGEAEEWPMFLATYTRTTKSCGFTDDENLSRLQKSLKGKAKEAVQPLLTVPANVNCVLETLKQMFGKPANIVEALIEKAKRVQASKEDKPETLIEFSCAIVNLEETMKNLKEDGDLKNPQLLKDLVRKLPSGLQLRWGELCERKGSSADLTDLSQWISTIAKAASHLTVYKQPDGKGKDGEKKANKFKGKENIYAASEKESSSTEKVCTYCSKKNHGIEECRSFLKKDVKARSDFVKEKRLCFLCLKAGHNSIRCESSDVCGKDGCKLRHHSILHNPSREKPEEKNAEKTAESVNANFAFPQTSRVLLSIVPVFLKSSHEEVKIYALLDPGATVTLLDFGVADKLKLQGQRRQMEMNWMCPTSQNVFETVNVDLDISYIKKENSFLMKSVQVMKNMDLLTQTVDMEKLKRKWKHLSTVEIESLKEVKPKIIIGQDNGHLILIKEAIAGKGNVPALTRTKLGWCVQGNASQLKGRVDKEFALHIASKGESDDYLHQLVKESMKTETFGVNLKCDKPRSKEDMRSREIMDATIRRAGDRWETGLLWKTDDTQLPPSKNCALKRMYTNERRMDKDSNFADLYCKKIEDYIQKGYVRKLTTEEASVENPRTWYLPHFGVFNPNKPGKLRLVFDAAAKSYGKSLNDELMIGPDMLCSLVGVLFRFRERKIGFSGDISDMFHRVKVRDEDLCAQRFLWRGMDRRRKPDVMQMDVMTFGASCSPSLAQEVKNKNAFEYQKEYPRAVEAIVSRHYVDDYLDSVNSEQEALQLIRDVIKIHREGGFRITSWCCSSRAVVTEVRDEERESASTEIKVHQVQQMSSKMFDSSSEMPVERVLGLTWDPEQDVFKFLLKFPKLNKEITSGTKTPTKRQVLSLVSSIFDPLGFVSHFTVRAKILLQEIWRMGIGLDDELPHSLDIKWKDWLNTLQEIKQIRVPRCYSISMENAQSRELHIFCDASEQAFASVAYLRTRNGEKVDVALIAGRSRVAPLKPMSILRLELQAAVMATRLVQTIKEEHSLSMDYVHYWTDSRTVLCWIRSDARRYKPFVSHRIGEILENSSVTEWHWIPTKMNVADDATRNSEGFSASPTSRWYEGPPFLKLKSCEWPREKCDLSGESEDCAEELKGEFLALVSSSQNVFSVLLSNSSSWGKLTRVTAWVLRFVNNSRKRNKGSAKYLQPNDYDLATKFWIKKMQVESFSSDIISLTKGKPLPKESRLMTLSPFLDNDRTLRVNGRVDKSPEMTESARRPIILDPKSKYIRLLILHYHVEAHHQGHETIINEIRQRYWILDARTTVRKVSKECQECKIAKATPHNPLMGNLPSFRLTRSERPFAVTGLDYFGPMEVTVGRRREKRYGALFTCLATRAVHLEIAHSLSTDSAIMAIRRMSARRGCPQKIFSDNGTNFRGADNELKMCLEQFDQEKISDEITKRGIEWHFIPPSAPSMGGSWERLVRSVKVALHVTLKERAPSDETLSTLMLEAESVVNSRPLTYVSVSPEDEEGITPFHFLIGTSSPAVQMGQFDDADLCLRKKWRIAQRLADNFWTRWIREYLPTLTRRTKWNKPTKPAKVGDLVVIADGGLQRGYWPRGIISAVYPGKDGVVRVVDVKTVSGTFRRPVSKVCILDVTQEVDKTAVLPLGGDMSLGQGDRQKKPKEKSLDCVVGKK